ncbi:sodium channel protein 1 brain-like [Babylonia areolata]|uniref:sodium channel protein 1 brain-like n=1 Tax=Babylonia areolata TaxID=304850 RepID=UPI003FD399BA
MSKVVGRVPSARKQHDGASPSSPPPAPDITPAPVDDSAAADEAPTNPETGEIAGDSAAAAADPQKSTRDEILSRIVSFHLFSEDSYRHLVERETADLARAQERASKAQEAHLVDGQLVFGGEEDENDKPPPRNPDFREGNVLREEYGIFPTDYFGRPLEEIDQGIRSKTFVVIAKKFRSKIIFRFSATRAFYLLAPWNLARRIALYIATHQLFDMFIILTILINCVLLTMPDLAWAETAEYVFLAIYVLEMVIKLLARGFIVNEYTYLRDPWNWLDFIVILIAFITIIVQLADPSISVGNLTGLRTFRVLRAFKTVSIVPGLKTIVNALLRAFKMLFEVILLICFCLMVFALFALQIYMGTLRQKCVRDIDSYTATPSLSYDQYYAIWIRDSANWQVDDEGDYQLCGNSSGTGGCNANYTCLGSIGENPNYGLTGFDHFGWSMLTSFQLLTLDFWEDTYNKVIRTSGPWNVVFFLVVIFFGAFYLFNLMLAVVAMSYEEEAINTGKEKERDKVANSKKKHNAMYDLAMLTAKSKTIHQQAKDSLAAKKGEEQDGDKNTKAKNTTTSQAVSKKQQPKVANSQKINVSPAKKTAKTQVNPQKPLVKVPSMDSGYSTQSQRSTTTKTKETVLVHQNSREVLQSPEDADTASMGSGPDMGKAGAGAVASHVTFKDSQSALEFKQKNPLVKQESMGTVSSSGVFLEKDGMSSVADDELISPRTRDEDVIIFTEDMADLPDETFEGKLVDRNCNCCRGCCRHYIPWLRLENFLYTIVSDPLFDLFITICIVINTIFLASEHHGMPSELETALNIGNYIFSSVFILEAILKICALNKFYFHNGWNIFDLVIVVASIVDLGVESVQGLSVLRTFRLLRVVKLAQSWATMRILLTIIINTFGALGYLTIILILIIYIFAVMGLQLFKTKYEGYQFGDTEATRWHFKDFYHSFMMIFRVLCGEWIEPLWQCMRAADELCMVVFLPALMIGNFLVLNLFLALLINAFATDTIDKHKESAKEANKLGHAFQRLKEIFCCCCPFVKKNTINPTKVKSTSDSPDPLINNAKGDKKNSNRVVTANGVIDGGQPKSNGMTLTSKKRAEYFDFNKARKAGKSKEPLRSVDAKVQSDAKAKVKDEVKFKDETKVKDAAAKGKEDGGGKSKDKDKEEEEVEDDLELGDTAESIQKDKDEDEEEEKSTEPPSCFPEWLRKRVNWIESFNASKGGQRWYTFRKIVLRVVDNRIFEWIVLFIIFASSITLAFEDIYLYQKSELQQALYILNILFCILFSLEMVMKWVAYGYTKYFTRFWTILDFFIVVISIASLIGESLGVSNITAFRSLRTLRAMRPLRAISRWPGMRIVVNALMRAIPAIFNVLLVCMMFWLIFSIMGVQLFSGRFYKCTNSTTGEVFSASVVPNKTYCLSLGETWENSHMHFDNTPAALLSLFQVATFEGWMEVMQDAVDVTKVDMQPDFEANKYAYIYFLVFIVVGAFFTLNLFISVIIDNFNVLKKKYEGSYLDAFLTDSQRNYYNTLKKLGNKKPQKTIKRPRSKFLKFFYNISMSTKFEMAIVLLISFNMVVMAVEHYNQTQAVTDTLKMLNVIFTSVFVLEAIVKLLGLRWHYFRVPWNIFDFLIVLMSILDIILDDLLNSVIIKPTLLRVVRVFRIGRVLRLIKSAKGIRKLLFALIISLPAIFNIGALLFLVMYIYAIIGMSSFGDIKLNGAVDDLTNFQTFGNSFLLLIRLATSAGWNDILDGLLIESPNCNSSYRTLPDGNVEASSFGDCGIPWLAIPFMVSYITVVYLIVINMYIAVILENFNQAHQQEEVGITEDDFDMFYVVWERYDPHATQFIKYEQLSDFVADLEDPLKIEKPNEITLVSFNLPIMEGDKLHCLDVLMALVKNHLSDVEETDELKKLREQMQEKFVGIFPSREKLGVKSTTLQRKKEDVAARTLQRAWRSHKTQKALKNITQLAMRQNSIRKNSATLERSRERLSGVRALGHRISSALSSFFGSSRPSSAISHISVHSPPPSPQPRNATHLQTLSKQGKLSNTLQVPKVTALYSQGQDKGSQLDLEL